VNGVWSTETPNMEPCRVRNLSNTSVMCIFKKLRCIRVSCPYGVAVSVQHRIAYSKYQIFIVPFESDLTLNPFMFFLCSTVCILFLYFFFVFRFFSWKTIFNLLWGYIYMSGHKQLKQCTDTKYEYIKHLQRLSITIQSKQPMKEMC